MKKGDIIFYYDYNEQFKVLKGRVKLINKIDENYYQEYWEVKFIRDGNNVKIWIGKPVEWYVPEKVLPKKVENSNFSEKVLGVGYNKTDGILNYKIVCYDYSIKKWRGSVSNIEKILYWKYFENTPVSLLKK